MSDDFRDKGGSPWGTPPGGGGNGSGKGPTPPDIDAIIRDIQNKINKFLPGGSKSQELLQLPSDEDQQGR